LNGTSGGQTTKLTNRESDILTVIDRECWPEFTIAMLQKATGLSNGNLHRILHGSFSRGYSYTGLLEKCPAIAYTDRTVVCEEDGMSMRRRSHAYTFERVLYLAWSSGGTTWIDDDLIPTEKNKFPTVPGITSENSVGENLKDSELIGEIESTYTHLDLIEGIYYGKSDLTYPPGKISDCTSASLCESEFSVGVKSISNYQGPLSESMMENAPIAPGKFQEHAENAGIFQEEQYFSESIGDNGNGKNKPNSKISPHDFKKLDFPDLHPCSKCGRKKDSWYI
jgi:hypothetical protein